MAVIDLSFVLVGATIPIDHGYSLFSALSRIVPALHGDRRAGVHPIRGRQSAPGVLSLTDRSWFKIRLPAEGIAQYVAIAGKELDLDGHRVRVGIPQVEALVPAANLAARLVTFKHAMDAEAFEADVRRELARMEIAAAPQLLPRNHPRYPGELLRRVMRVKRHPCRAPGSLDDLSGLRNAQGDGRRVTGRESRDTHGLTRARCCTRTCTRWRTKL
jgi:CRISPR-associated protein Cas6